MQFERCRLKICNTAYSAPQVSYVAPGEGHVASCSVAPFPLLTFGLEYRLGFWTSEVHAFLDKFLGTPLATDPTP